MKAAVYYQDGDIRVEDVAPPGEPGPGELLVRVRACGVCGSDVSTWYMDPRAPAVLGHEPAGDVVAAGAGAGFAVGDRVILHHHVPCMVCALCRRGAHTQCAQFKATRLYPAAMAEYVRVPAAVVRTDVLKLPEGMPYEAGALVEPAACCVRGLDRANIQIGDTVVILGAGFSGVVSALLAPHWGAVRVALLDRVPVRIARAEALGIHTLDAREDGQVRAWLGEAGAQAVIITPGSIPAIQSGFELAGPGATVLMFGLPHKGEVWPLDANRVLFEEITLTGTYSASPHDTRRALSLLENGLLDADALITHRFPLDRAAEAWQLTKEAHDSLKVIVEI